MNIYFICISILILFGSCHSPNPTQIKSKKGKTSYVDSIKFPIQIKGEILDKKCGWPIKYANIFIFQDNKNLLGSTNYYEHRKRETFNITIEEQTLSNEFVDIIAKSPICDTDTMKSISLKRNFKQSPLIIELYCPSSRCDSVTIRDQVEESH